jgi:APA family basic amino acid/polyamine antiporter
MIVAGSMIGSGIFIVAADITRHVGSSGWLIAVWLLTGFMTITAAVSYGELSGMFPKAGGQYVYLKEAYNPLIAFLYGWSLFLIIQPGTIAAVGVAFAKFTAFLIPAFSEEHILFQFAFIKVTPAQLLAIFTIILLTYVNTRGVENGKLVQTTLTIVKLISLFGLIVAGFVMADAEVWNANWTNPWSIGEMTREGISELATIAAVGAVASAMVGSIFSSDAWNNVTFIAGEIKNPQRNIGLSLFLGTLIVTIIYVSANVMYTAVLPLADIAFAANDRVAVAASTEIFGDVGTKIIAVMIMISTFGCNNGLILSGARVYFKQVGNLNKFSVPHVALWIQCFVTCFWCLSGTYGDLLDMISFGVVVFYMLTIVGIFILRRTKPDAPRPYKAFGYPVLPIIYIIMGTTFCIFLAVFKPAYTLTGVALILVGIPIYYYALSKKRTA